MYTSAARDWQHVTRADLRSDQSSRTCKALVVLPAFCLLFQSEKAVMAEEDGEESGASAALLATAANILLGKRDPTEEDISQGLRRGKCNSSKQTFCFLSVG